MEEYNIIREMEVKYKTTSRKKYLLEITSPTEVVTFLKDLLQNETQESFIAIFLDGAHRINGYRVIAKGSANDCRVHPRECFKGAVLSNSISIIVAHNHPSGKLEPSESDIKFTEKLKKGAEILEINILDHLIVSNDGYYSFVETGGIL
jgi:DNA repair protein RadC